MIESTLIAYLEMEWRLVMMFEKIDTVLMCSMKNSCQLIVDTDEIVTAAVGGDPKLTFNFA